LEREWFQRLNPVGVKSTKPEQEAENRILPGGKRRARRKLIGASLGEASTKKSGWGFGGGKGAERHDQ